MFDLDLFCIYFVNFFNCYYLEIAFIIIFYLFAGVIVLWVIYGEVFYYNIVDFCVETVISCNLLWAWEWASFFLYFLLKFDYIIDV